MAIATSIIAAGLAGGAALGAAALNRSSVKDANESAQTQRSESQAFIERQGEQGREDVLRLAPLAEESRLKGFEGALDVFSQALPQQFQAFQGGNVGAQQIQLAGLDQQKRALLGLPTADFSQVEPLQLETPQLQGELPSFPSVNEPFPQQPGQQPQPQSQSPALSQRFDRILERRF